MKKIQRRGFHKINFDLLFDRLTFYNFIIKFIFNPHSARTTIVQPPRLIVTKTDFSLGVFSSMKFSRISFLFHGL